MKALLINGSPRWKGNTNRALEEVAGALEAEGLECEIAWIGNKPIRGRCVFDDDPCNELIAKAAEADAIVIGSPVYYAGANGSLIGLLDRMFYAGGPLMRFKPAAGVAVARRAGTTLTVDQINKYFQINCMPVASSTYWALAHGRAEGEVAGDGEGLHTLRMLGRNLAWLAKSLEAGRAAGIEPPAVEPKVMTNFVRDDLLEA